MGTHGRIVQHQTVISDPAEGRAQSRAGPCSGTGKRGILRALIILLAVCLSPASAACASADQVVYVFDGDTVKMGDGRRVRLVGIDAPETRRKDRPGQPYGRESTQYLSDLVLGEHVTVRAYGIDDYGRILGELLLDGRNINLAMVAAGMAEAYRGKPAPGLDIDAYRGAEKRARRALRGIWRQGDRYVSPRTWRRRHR